MRTRAKNKYYDTVLHAFKNANVSLGYKTQVLITSQHELLFQCSQREKMIIKFVTKTNPSRCVSTGSSSYILSRGGLSPSESHNTC